MKADRHHKSRENSSSASDNALDPHSPEFIAACLALFKQPAARGRAMLAAEEASSHAAAPGSEDNQNGVARSRPHESVGRRRRAIALETHVDEFSEARGEAPSQVAQSFGIPREPDRDVESAALREAKRREAEVRTELQMLQTKITNLTLRHDDTVAALKAATQRVTQARAELVSAMTVISERDVTIEQLHRIVSAREREIAELQSRLLEAEEARMADAAAFLESLDPHRT